MFSIKESMKIAAIPVLFASLCCLSPLLLFVFGLASVSVAASLADVFYGTYKWLFRVSGIILLLIGLVMYFRKKNICTFDEVKKQRTRIINTVIITTVIAIIGYILFLYGVVHYLGLFLGLW